MFCCVRPDFYPVSSVFLSLHKNTEQISMKFTRDNRYHKQIKWLHFSDIGTGTREQDTA